SGAGQATPGQILRAARLGRGLSIQDVARQLRLSVRQVTALEEDDYSKLSSGTFLRGFVRNYAKLLQLDPAPLLQRIEEALPPPQTQTISYQIEGIPFPSGRNRGKRAVIMGLAIVIALSLLIYEIYRGNETNVERREAVEKAPVSAEIKDQADTPASAPQSSLLSNLLEEAGETGVPQTEEENRPSLDAAEPAFIEKKTVRPPIAQAPAISPPSKPALVPVPGPTTAVPPKPAGGESPAAAAIPESADGSDVVRLSFEGDSWTEVKDGRGKLLLSRINRSGTEQVLRGKSPFALTIGNAAEVKLVYNNKPVDLARYTNAYGGTARLSLE
ncbi:MAG TPA: RodZ family helix-turn-helix domain-containing protein, partial [Nitrosospira sp.]|nr:RodZ family helix-turn-helix domain-containing protein [Nitrosospira sp.]